jgi:restriction endonuclease Mrr
MRIGSKSVAETVVQNIALDAPPSSIEELVIHVINLHPEWGFDPIEKANTWAPQIYKILQRLREDQIKQDRQPAFEFNSSSNYMIQGACFVEPCDSDDVKNQKRKRLHWQEYHAALRELTPRQFEILCVRILGLLGVTEPQLTQYQGDQGIDFFGRLSIGDLVGHGPAFPILETRLIVWMIGQAKHYRDTKVATPDIRELVGATTLGRARAFAQENMYQNLRIRVCDPVVMLFFTTGEISRDGWTLCKNSGVVAMDGQMLAAFLADKGVAMNSIDAVNSVDRLALLAWLGEPTINSDQ